MKRTVIQLDTSQESLNDIHFYILSINSYIFYIYRNAYYFIQYSHNNIGSILFILSARWPILPLTVYILMYTVCLCILYTYVYNCIYTYTIVNIAKKSCNKLYILPILKQYCREKFRKKKFAIPILIFSM